MAVAPLPIANVAPPAQPHKVDLPVMTCAGIRKNAKRDLIILSAIALPILALQIIYKDIINDYFASLDLSTIIGDAISNPIGEAISVATGSFTVINLTYKKRALINALARLGQHITISVGNIAGINAGMRNMTDAIFGTVNRIRTFKTV